jgi:hypothetical protein
MTPEQRAELRARLLASGLCGETRTTRESVVVHAEKLAAGDPDKFLGIGARGRDATGIMRAVAELCGCSERLEERDGSGVIDPERTLDALAAAGKRLAQAAERGQAALVATGHPSGLLTMYQGVAAALAAAGAKVLTPLEDQDLVPPAKRKRRRYVRYFDGAGVLLAGADPIHTHESWPMEQLLDACDPPPDLILADHGFAGASLARGIDTICFTDVNDPAIAVARADDLVRHVIPLDDNRVPSAYDPIRDYLIGCIAN